VEVTDTELFDIQLFTCLDYTELCSLTESMKAPMYQWSVGSFSSS